MRQALTGAPWWPQTNNIYPHKRPRGVRTVTNFHFDGKLTTDASSNCPRDAYIFQARFFQSLFTSHQQNEARSDTSSMLSGLRNIVWAYAYVQNENRGGPFLKSPWRHQSSRALIKVCNEEYQTSPPTISRRSDAFLGMLLSYTAHQ